MDILRPQTPFARMVGAALAQDWFTLVDVGCGGGLPDAWRAFGPRLRALGLDSDSHETDRLQALEANPQVRYRGALIEAGAVAEPGRSPWPRLAIAEWKARHAALPAHFGGEAPVASVQAAKTIPLPQAIAEAGLDRVDFIKLDVDGPDFGILRTLDGALGELEVLGVGVEVNFIGSGGPDENSFHNMDGWMRGQGLDLFDLSIRRYAMATLPGRTRLDYPAETHIGRPFQGDAVYLRDLCAPQNAALAAGASAGRLLKLAALYSLFGLPDCAAEVLIVFRVRLEPQFDVAAGLDLLAAEAQAGDEAPVGYERYMQAYAAEDPYFRLKAPSLRARDPGQGKPCTAMDMAAPVLHGEAQYSSKALSTGPGQWSYAAEWPLDRTALGADGYLRLLLEVDVEAGVVGVGLLNPDRISFSDEVAVQAGDGPTRVELLTPKGVAVVSLMARNFDPSGTPSRARLRLVDSTLF
jgi:hypothetical protein